jgi:hypothetical protein
VSSSSHRLEADRYRLGLDLRTEVRANDPTPIWFVEEPGAAPFEVWLGN